MYVCSSAGGRGEGGDTGCAVEEEKCLPCRSSKWLSFIPSSPERLITMQSKCKQHTNLVHREGHSGETEPTESKDKLITGADYR